MLVWESVQGDASVSTGTLEKPLHAVMPVVFVLLTDAGLQQLEVGVGARLACHNTAFHFSDVSHLFFHLFFFTSGSK